MKYKMILLVLMSACTLTYAQKPQDCATCATRELRREELNELSIDEIRYLTNDLFARRGYVFQSAEIDAYYSNKAWYKPVNANYTIEYNAIEKQNIKLFQDITKELVAGRNQMVEALKRFKSVLDAGDKEALAKQYQYRVETTSDFIKNVTDELFMDDIHWAKHKGLYRVTKDNGDIVKDYVLKIDGNQVVFEFALRGASEIDREGSLYPREYMSEASYAYVFEYVKDKLVFKKLVVAG